jgi:hypothetical protein
VVGFLNSGSPGSYPHNVREFQQGLRQAGFVEGCNVAIEYRWAEDRTDRLPAMAADLIRRQVTVIFANGPAALPAKAATATIPIVFATAVDPVEVGVPTAKPKRLTVDRESVDSRCDGRSLQADLVRRGRTVPVARCIASRILILRHQLNVLRGKVPSGWRSAWLTGRCY